MTTAEISEIFNAKTIARGRYQALCIAHPDKSPSLVITEGLDGRTLIKCWAGCSLESILAAAGLKKRDLFGKSRPLSPIERQAIEKQRHKTDRRAEIFRDITRYTFDSERMAEIELRRWGATLALIPEGHEHEQALIELFHLSCTAFQEAEAASLGLLDQRPRVTNIQSHKLGAERVAA
jgi:hypothetical protein